MSNPNVPAERTVLAWCLFEDGAYDWCASRAGLTSLAFELPPHRAIWDAMSKSMATHRTTKLHAVVDVLEGASQISSAGGLEYVQRLFDSHASGRVAETYAKRLGGALRRREYVTALLAEAAKSGHSADDDDFIEQSVSRLQAMSKARGSDALLVPIKDCIAEAVAHIQGVSSGRIGKGVPSGIRKLDEMTDCFKGGELVIVAARTSVGKTAFAIGNAIATAKEGNPCAVFSLEMSRADVAFRAIAAEGDVDLKAMRSASMSPRQMEAFQASSVRVSQMPIKVFGGNALVSSDIDIGGIRSLARGFRKENGNAKTGLIVVDYLQLVQAMGMDEKKRHEVVGALSRGLKMLAMELQWPVVALSQLNREADKRDRPKLADLRESGSIEQDADTVILLHRPHKDGDTTDAKPSMKKGPWASSEREQGDPNYTEIIIAKNRNGPLGVVEATYRAECALFTDRTFGY